MAARSEHKKLFQELEQWSQRKNAFAISEFLFEKGATLIDYYFISNSSKDFMEIRRLAEGKIWENVQEAGRTNSIPKSQLSEYILEHDTGDDTTNTIGTEIG